ncbi:hypothetical protein B0A48_10310 [Cryoendolithus antarcticus]|uniref:Dipeptidyl-peptidase V n=1 Tax=Cryoendolithus antarcticus TaxID=1507870 RepID=A0A1V8SWV9_9PEZI|nr:hypothetical protein B0A48_10310 [Cryoendolithus antarcticus]
MPIPESLLKDLLALEAPTSVTLSPNGKRVLYSTNLSWAHKKGADARSTLWLAETNTLNSARQISSGLFYDTVPVWSPDSEHVAFVSDRAKSGDRSAIYVMNVVKGGEGVAVTDVKFEKPISKVMFSPDGKKIAFLSGDEKTPEKKKRDEEKDDPIVWGEEWDYTRLRVVDLASKEVKTLVHGAEHVLDFDWNGTGDSIVVMTTARPDVESQMLKGTGFGVVQVASGERREVGGVGGIASSLICAGDDFCFVAPFNEGKASSGLSVYRASIHETEANFTRVAHGETDCARNLVKVGEKVFVKVQQGLVDKIYHLGGEPVFEVQKEILSWHATITDDKATTLALAIGDINTPPEVHTTTSSSTSSNKDPITLSTHGTTFAKHTFGTATAVETSSFDGKETLDGLFLTPESSTYLSSPSKSPGKTAVIIHGGPYYRRTNAFDAQFFFWTPCLLAAGYSVLMPNYRGSSGRGERFAAYSIGGMGKFDETDVVALTQAAIDKGLADKENLVVGGYSQGGYLTYLSAVRNGLHGKGWKFKGGIAGAGVTDWATMGMSSDAGAYETELLGHSPWSADKEDCSDRQGSAIWEMKGAVKNGGVIPPMLILHGEKDVRVPVEQAQGFRRGLEAAGLPYEYVVYPREDHTFVEQGHVRDMCERVVKFVDKCLA